jgi:hypothetical protein
MSVFQAAHVYQPGNIPPMAENTERAQYVVYGQKFTGEHFQNIFIHDEPVTKDQQTWFDEDLLPRIAPGGVVRTLASPSPVSELSKTPIPSTHGLPIIRP